MLAGFRRHTMLLLTVPVTLLLAVLVLIADLNADSAARSAQRSERLRAQVMLAGLTQQYLSFTFLEIQREASTGGWTLQRGDAADRAALDAWVSRSPLRFVGATLTDLAGSPLTAVGRTPADPADPGFAALRKDLQAGRPGLSGVLRSDQGPLVGIALPVNRQGKAAGLLVAYSDLRTWPLQTYVQRLDLGAGASYGVVDGRGLAVASSEPSRLGTPLGIGLVTRPLLEERDATIVSAAPVGTDSWTSVTTQSASDFYAPLGTARRWLLVALAALALVLVGFLVVTDLRRRRVLDRLADEAIYDHVTSVGTRRLLDLRMSAALARHARNGSPLAVLFCDLDGFKQVNDRFGHAAGDRVLRTTAARIKQQLREDDFLARVGGDEFVVVMEHTADATDLAAVASRLRAAVADPVPVGSRTARIGVSIGIACAGEQTRDGADLLLAADEAMYRAKSSGDGYAFAVPHGSGSPLPRPRPRPGGDGDGTSATPGHRPGNDA